MQKEFSFNDKDAFVMKLLHYFITDKGYNPIILRGIENEIWLENMEGPYKIVRINMGYIHNKDQMDFDMFKTKKILSKIKLKTCSLSLNALSIFLDLGDSVNLEPTNNVKCVQLLKETDINKSSLIIDAFPDISNKLVFNERGIDLFAKITNDINKKNAKEALEAEDVFKEKTPYVTYGLIALNIIMFILTYIFGNGSEDTNTLLKFGALNKYLVLNGEYHRLFTSAFLHIGILHLASNMYSLYILGKEIESYFGKLKYLIIYVVSALVGSFLSIILMDEYVVSAGASGAIFGLMGALLYFGYYYRVMLNNAITKQILPLILLNLFIGMMSSSINNIAHVGGLIGGLIAAIAVGVKYKSSKSEKINGIIVLILLFIFLIFMTFIR